jgi:hypothetical protein
LLLIFAALATWLARGLSTFLSVNSPVGAQVLVVEGWMPSYAYREAAALFRQGGYRNIIAAGVAHDDADDVPDARTDSGVDDLVKAGVPRDRIDLATSSEKQLDRTFHSAEAVKRLLLEKGIRATSLDILTVGPHARRSRLLYEGALGGEFKIGIIALPDRRFDPEHWWRSSEGVRAVVDETVAYLYARLYFSTTH